MLLAKINDDLRAGPYTGSKLTFVLEDGLTYDLAIEILVKAAECKSERLSLDRRAAFITAEVSNTSDLITTLELPLASFVPTCSKAKMD